MLFNNLTPDYNLFDYYNRVLLNIKNSVEQGFYELEKEELSRVVLELTSKIGGILKLREIEALYVKANSIDTFALQKAVSLIKETPPVSDVIEFSDKWVINFKEKVGDLSDGINVMEENYHRWEKLETGLRIELALNPLFEDILMFYEPDSDIYKKLFDIISPKLKLIPKEDVQKLFTRIENEFSKYSLRQEMIYDKELMGPNFFKVNNVEEMISKTTDYIIRLRPQLIKIMGTHGINMFPLSIGIAKLLAFSPDTIVDELKRSDLTMLATFSRIIYIWEKTLNNERKELCDAIGVDTNGVVASGEQYTKYEELSKNMRQEKEQIIYLFMLINKLLEYSKEYVSKTTPVYFALLQYKLGNEVTLPESRKNLESKSETVLQKELSKFMLERNIYCYGTKFGQSQIDLLTEEGGEKFIIETKIYKSRPTEQKLKRNIVQLQSYMEQHFKPRGILVIYNFSDTIVDAPKKWIIGKYWILSINLIKTSPSQTKRSFCIEENQDAVIRCYNIVS